MNVHDFFERYILYGAIITSWNWAESHRLVLEVDLSNLNQRDYSDIDPDFRPIIISLNRCSVSDTLGAGFDGFTAGDARIIAADPIDFESFKLVFMHDVYDGGGEKLISIAIGSASISVVDERF